MDSRDWPPENLQAYINRLRALIAWDQKLYREFNEEFSLWESALWVAIGTMLKARSRYYRGEIIRAKHDTQRYALGEDVREPTRWGVMVCDWATTYLDDIPSGGYSGPLGDSIRDLTIHQMQRVTEDFEKITYGG